MIFSNTNNAAECLPIVIWFFRTGEVDRGLCISPRGQFSLCGKSAQILLKTSKWLGSFKLHFDILIKSLAEILMRLLVESIKYLHMCNSLLLVNINY